MKIYDYDNRTLIEFNDKTRKNYSKGSKYGFLQDKVVKQAVENDMKLGNPFEIYGDNKDVRILYYDQLKNDVLEILVDYDDWLEIRNCYWGLSTAGYAVTSDKKFLHLTQSKKIFLHNVIMNHHDHSEKVVDHINRNPLDNRKSNLRIVENQVNHRNRQNNIHNKYGLPSGITKRKNHYEVRVYDRNGNLIRKTFPLDQFCEADLYNQKQRKEYGYLEERATTIENTN